MTPRLYLFSGALLAVFTLFLLACRYWPIERSGTTFRQQARDVIGLAAGLLSLAAWVLTELPRLAKGSRREAIR